MATERLSMRQIREILRQKWALGLSHRAVASSLKVGLGTISSVVTRAQGAGLDWPQVQPLSDEVLEGRLYGRPEVAGQRQRPAPDCAWIHAERRRPSVTLELLHLEYLERHPDGYRYTRFCDLYRRWLERRRLSMRQVHRAGEKCFVDYAGQKPRLIDPTTGEVVEVELFAAVLGASNYTYAEATRTQQVPDWIASHARAFAFFGGVTAAVVCDQLKSGVVVPCRYEPGLQRTYEDFAEHYGTAILPARPAKPRDKAKIEAGVLVRVITLIDGTPSTKVEGTESASAFPVSVSPHVVGRSMETAGATPGQVRAVIRRRAATEPPCAPRGCVLAHAPRALDVPARHTEEAHTPGAPISNSRSKSPPFRAAQVHGIRSFFNCHDN